MGVAFDSWVMDVLVLFFTMFLVLYATFKINYGHWKRKGVPYLEPTFPFGNGWGTILMKKSPGEEIRDLYQNTKDQKVVGIFSINRPVLVVRDPELIKLVMVKDFSYMPDRGLYVDEKTDHLSAHLFTLGGAKWRALRNKLSPTFTSGKMRAMFGIVRDCARTLAEVTPTAGDVEVRELIARYSTDAIASCAFGIDVDSQHNPEAEFRVMGRRNFELSWRNFFAISIGALSPQTRKLFAIPITPKDITEYFTQIVADTVEHREKAGIIRKDFMQLLIQLKNNGYVDDSFEINLQETGERKTNSLTIKELAAQAWVFFLGGFETSSTTTSFCLYELARHQDIQRRLQEEIDQAMSRCGGEITYEMIMSEMPYLDKVLSEALRKYPAVPFLNREVARDYKLPGYDFMLEKGTSVVIPVWGLHNDPQYFQNPEGFDPEHFSEEQKAARHPFSYLPFGEGPRICIGMRFGQMQVKLALVHLLYHYRFLPTGDPKSQLRFSPYSLVPTTVDGIHLRTERRSVPAC